MKAFLAILAVTLSFTLVSLTYAHPRQGGEAHINSGLPVTGNYATQSDTGSEPFMAGRVGVGYGEWNSATHMNETLASWSQVGGHPDPGVWGNIIFLGHTVWAAQQSFDGSTPPPPHYHYFHSHIFYNTWWHQFGPVGGDDLLYSQLIKNLACHELGHHMGLGHVPVASDCLVASPSHTSDQRPKSHSRQSFWEFYSVHTPTNTDNDFSSLELEYRIARMQQDDNVIIAHAAWMYQPKDIKDMTTHASDVVTAVVRKISDGPTLGKQYSDTDHVTTIPTQRVTVEVLERFKGEAPGEVTIFRTGGLRSDGRELVLKGNPPYKLGETLLLYLEPKLDEEGTYHVVAPEGRYLVGGGNRVIPVVSRTELGRTVHGMPLADLIAQGLQKD